MAIRLLVMMLQERNPVSLGGGKCCCYQEREPSKIELL